MHARSLSLAILAPAWVLAAILTCWPNYLGGWRVPLAWAFVCAACLTAAALALGPLRARAERLDPRYAHRAAVLSCALALGLVVFGELRTRERLFIPFAQLLGAAGLTLSVAALLKRRPPARSVALLLLTATLLGVAMRVGLAVSFPSLVWSNDSSTYWWSGMGLITTGSISDLLRPPGYPAFVALVWSLGGVWALHLVQGLCGLLTAGAVGLAVRSRAGDAWGGLAYALVFLNPTSVFVEHMLLAEAPFTALLSLFVLALLHGLPTAARSTRLGFLAVAGLLVGLATLLKPVALAAVCAGGLAVLLARGPWVKGGGVYSLAVLVAVCPWAARNQAQHGFFGLSQGVKGASLVCATAHVIDLDAGIDPAMKARIRPAIEAFRERGDLGNHLGLWQAGGILDSCRDLPIAEADRRLSAIAFEGIRGDPLGYAWGVLYRARHALLPDYVFMSPPPYGDLHLKLLTLQVPPAPEPPPVVRAWAYDASRAAINTINGLLYPLYSVLHLLACATWIVRRKRIAWVPLLVAGAILALTYGLTTLVARYLVPLVPLYVLAICGSQGRALHEDEPVAPDALARGH